MRSDPGQRVSKIVVAGLLLLCIFVSTSEAYLCRDCHPAGSVPVLPAALQATIDDAHSSDQEHHSPGSCPVCLSPSLVASDELSVFLTAVHRVSQDNPRPLSGIRIPIYKPPLISP